MRGIVIAIAALVIGGNVASASIATHAPHRKCPEDAVWIGTGNYSHGYWSHYVCVSGDSATHYWRIHT